MYPAFPISSIFDQKQLSAEDVGLLKNPICQELVQCTDEAGEEYCFRGSGGVVKYSKNKNREKKMGRTLNCSEHIEVEARTSEGSLSIALLSYKKLNIAIRINIHINNFFSSFFRL